MTKMQASPTTPTGLKTNTTPYGARLEPLNILAATLGVTNVSFVANVPDWMPEVMFKLLKLAYHHKGLSIIRIVQRCPHYLPHLFDPLVTDPARSLMLLHDDGLEISDDLAKVYKNQLEHDPSNLDRARELASQEGIVPVGVLYRNDDVPVYDDLMKPKRVANDEIRRDVLEREFDKFAVHAN